MTEPKQNPLVSMIEALQHDMATVAAPGPTTLRRWQDRLAHIQHAVVSATGHAGVGELSIVSGVSHRTGQGFVTLGWGTEHGQLTVEETRAHALRLLEAAEAAQYDSIFVQWLLTHKLVTTSEDAVPLLLSFRAFREAQMGASLDARDPIRLDDQAP